MLSPQSRPGEATIGSLTLRNCGLGAAQSGVALVLLTGCGSGTGPDRVISSLGLEVSTPEREPSRYILVVGEHGSARVSTESQDCIFDSPCFVAASGSLRSSDPSVLQAASERVRTPAQVELVGVGPGTAQLTATVQGLTQSARVDVVAAPLPVDSIRIRSDWSGSDSLTEVVHDPGGRLVSVTLPVLGYAALETHIFRANELVELAWTITSSDPGIVDANRNCRPAIVDPQCEVVSSGGWVTGLSAGSATVTVTARNVQTTFSVTVE